MWTDGTWRGLRPGIPYVGGAWWEKENLILVLQLAGGCPKERPNYLPNHFLIAEFTLPVSESRSVSAVSVAMPDRSGSGYYPSRVVPAWHCRTWSFCFPGCGHRPRHPWWNVQKKCRCHAGRYLIKDFRSGSVMACCCCLACILMRGPYAPRGSVYARISTPPSPPGGAIQVTL